MSTKRNVGRSLAAGVVSHRPLTPHVHSPRKGSRDLLPISVLSVRRLETLISCRLIDNAQMLSFVKSRSRGRLKSFVGNGLKPFSTIVRRNDFRNPDTMACIPFTSLVFFPVPE
jgi:hypothetical protein